MSPDGFGTRAGLLVALLALPGCHAFYVVSGRVEDCETRAPIADAEVGLDVPELERRGRGTSSETGEFRVAVNSPPADVSSELTVRKAGYTEARQSVTDPEAAQRVCLRRSAPH